jgi:nitrate/nitrite transporter NarK
MTESSSKNLKSITLDTQTSSVFTTSYDPSTPLFFLPIICFLIILLVIVNILIYIYKKYYCLENKQKDSEDSMFDEVQFEESKKLKLKYFLAYILTRGSVWSKSPYLYTMYNKYHGFTIDEIGILYVIDAVTALISGPALGNLADKYGRKLFCVNYCILVIANLSLRITGSKSLAYLAQVLTGLGAGLIMTTFESWVNYEANKIFKENSACKEKFLKKLFKQQSLSDALTSLFITSITAVAFSKYGILFPIWLSMLLAGLALGVILLFWEENKPNEEIK